MPVRTARRPDTGLIKPSRPKPHDFRERYLEMGWDREIEEHYRCNWRCIRRWILEEGREQLRADRAAAVRARRADANIARLQSKALSTAAGRH